MESQAPSSVVTSGVTGETTLSSFFLAAFEEKAELNRLEARTAGVVVTGIDGVQRDRWFLRARSLVTPSRRTV